MSTPTNRILMIEDDPGIRRFVRLVLEDEGWQVFEADSARRGLIEAASRQPDLVILDLGLPDADGKQVLTELRGWSSVPVLVLSAREREDEGGRPGRRRRRLPGQAFRCARAAGPAARDAAPPPATGAAGGAVASSQVHFGQVQVDLATHEVRRAGQPVHLTPIEFRLLAALIAAQGRVMTHRQLLLQVWGPEYLGRAHYLRVHMANLRQKIEDEPAQPRHLVTELQVGYRLVGLGGEASPGSV